jgi:glycosyltransferase involved in cell wall biosynthesis
MATTAGSIGSMRSALSTMPETLRVMAFGHCYMDELPRRKWYALSREHDDVEICVVTPKVWPDAFRTLRSVPRTETRLSFVPLTTLGSGYGSRYCYTSPRLLSLMVRFKPTVIHVDHEPWSIAYAQISSVASLVAPAAKRVVFSWWNLPRRVPFPWSMAHRWCLSQTAMIIAGNHDTEATHRAHGYRGPTVVMPQLGVDVDAFHPDTTDLSAQNGTARSGPVVIGFVGRLIPEKGVSVLLQALPQITHLPWQAVIVGSGPAKPDLERQAERLGIADRTTFVGSVEQDRVPEWMRRLDVLVLPSTRAWREQFGHVLVEAMASGVAVIGSDSGEIPHVIGDVGFVFSDGDHATLASNLAKLITDRALSQSLARRGRERALSHYSDNAVAEQLYTVYSNLEHPST